MSQIIMNLANIIISYILFKFTPTLQDRRSTNNISNKNNFGLIAWFSTTHPKLQVLTKQKKKGTSNYQQLP